MISSYSFAISVVLFNAAIILVYLLRRRQHFIIRYGFQTLLFITILALVRLIAAIDFKNACVLRSEKLIPAVQNALNYQIINDLSLGRILLLLWGVGIVFCIFRVVVKFASDSFRMRYYKSVDDDRYRRIADNIGLKNSIIVTTEVSEPYVAGIINQSVYIPPMNLSDRDIGYILTHEMHHIRYHDQLIKLFFLLIKAIFWWNPISHKFYAELETILELRCDSAVADKLDEKGRVEYCEAMINAMNCIKANREKEQILVSTFTKAKDKKGYDIKQRFNVVLNIDKKKSRAVRTALCVLIVVLFLASYSVIVQPVYFPPEEDLLGTLEADVSSSFILYDGEKYLLYIDNAYFRELSEDELDDEPHNSMIIINGGS